MENDYFIVEAQKGNLTAYSELVRVYSPVVERFAFQLGASGSDVQDISQEVFIRVYRFLHQFSHSKFTTWLYKITLNVTRDFKRKENRQLMKTEKLSKETFGADLTMPEVTIFREEEDKLLHECIQKLDEKYRIPIILHYFHDKKYEEIQDILSLNPSTVKTRLLRGKNLLKKALVEAEKKEGENHG
ncbi:RNA polymerase sigma factor [Bacillus sp. SG-1]|uniref:RNA polymerase sigma factor n=1 Tax=Bacillus sp. SG-1 TaxID=161544 RepID=UPI000154460A|nr:RNA polymerase sigma factor [Bacillus sp. SG-1]EDL62569.1 RNA polymerase sigma factor Y [Bacillus sp. SG-1]